MARGRLLFRQKITALQNEIREKRHLANRYTNYCVVCPPRADNMSLQRRQSFCSLETLESRIWRLHDRK